MAIYRMVGEKEDLAQVPVTSFGQAGVLERRDLQWILRDKPEILEDGLFILAEEFSIWQDSNRRIDLLGLDTTGRLVVVELKRGDTGEHMDLQAIRYAAMVANMTFQQVVDNHQAYLDKRALDDGKSVESDAESNIREHLGIVAEEEPVIHTEVPRIILASEGFGKELTTCAWWLNNNGLDVTCIRIQPYNNSGEILVETSQIIPLPELADLLVQVRERENEARQQRSSGSFRYTGSGDAFRDSIENAREEFQPDLTRIYQWAVGLEQDNLATLSTGLGQTTSMPITVPGKSALVSIYNAPDNARILFYASNFRKLAPSSIPFVDKLTGGASLRNIQTSTPRNIGVVSDELLAVLRDAYREANGLPGNGAEGGGGR